MFEHSKRRLLFMPGVNTRLEHRYGLGIVASRDLPPDFRNSYVDTRPLQEANSDLKNKDPILTIRPQATSAHGNRKCT